METTSLLHDPAFWLLVLFAIPLILRVPIALALGFSALVVVWQWDLGFSMLSYNFFAGIAKFPLLAIPFFILAGYIMERSGIAARIVALMEALVGSMTGGLALATVAVATFWGAVSGSGPATVAALGLILIPGMAKAGYDKAFAAATVSVTSGLAIVIPPSIAFIVYGSVADVSVPALFAAGFVPGIVVALFIMAAVLIISRKRGYRGQPSGKSVGTALKEAFWGVMTPVVILGGIYGGVFTPTEAAAVAVFYGLFVGVFIYRTINSISILVEIFAASIRATAVVMLVVTCAGLFSWVASTVGLVEKGSAVAAGCHFHLLRFSALHAAHHGPLQLGPRLVRHHDDSQPGCGAGDAARGREPVCRRQYQRHQHGTHQQGGPAADLCLPAGPGGHHHLP